MKRLQKIIHKSLTAVIFCSCFFLSARSQSCYFLQAKIPATGDHPESNYKILLSLLSDGSANARIQYVSVPQNKLCLYELSLTDTSVVGIDTTQRCLAANAEPIPLLENDPAGFVVPRFIFKKQFDNASTYFTPVSVETKTNTGAWVAAQLESVQQKTYEELVLDEPFVSSFYFESDGFYQYLFNDKTKATVSPRTERLFLFTVANTNDATVGKSAAADLENISALFTNIAAGLGITKIISFKISGDVYSKLAVQSTLMALAAQHPGTSDIIIFYFSGHGFRLPGDVSAYPNLSFRTDRNRQKNEVGDYIPLESVYNQLMALRPKVCLVFGDCCNANIYENPVFGTDLIRPKGGGMLGDFNIETAKKLFFPVTPMSLLLGSVQKDHLSVGNTSLGGYFTHFFTAEMQKNLWGYFSRSVFSFGNPSNTVWLSMLLEARKNTYWKAKATQCGVTENDRCIQQAEIRITP